MKLRETVSQKLFRSDLAKMGDHTSMIPKIVDRNI